MAGKMAEDFVVTPWEVHGVIDYAKLIERFGTQPIQPELIERVRKIAGEVHPMLSRGIFYSHRDFNWILDEYEKGNRFVLYTGRGPSSGIHLGHMLPWILTRWLQAKFQVKLYFQITDDEKFLFKDFESLNDANKIAYDNILDIIATGFDPKLTRIFLDTEYIHHMYPVAVRVAKHVTFSTTRAVFGFEHSNNIGEIFYTSMQAVPCFLESIDRGKNVPCIIPCGIDQDPHFRITRDVAPLLGFYKPALLHCKLLPSLQGFGAKMSSSQPETVIFAADSEKETRRKIGNALTGGRATVEEQRRLGANPDICVVYANYQYIFEPDEDHLKVVHDTCKSGARLCGECKAELADKVVAFLEKHQERREKARDHIEEFMLRD